MIRPQTCPICDKDLPPEVTLESPHFPFCSDRCRQIDLLRWAEGQYGIVEPLTPERLAEQMLEGDEETGYDGLDH